MATNITKKTRVITVDSLQKLVDGFTKHAATTPSLVFAGATLKPSDVVARLQALIAQHNAVNTAAAAWHSQVTTERNAALQMRSLLGLIKQMLEGAYSSQLDVLADFGLAPRKKTVVSPQTRAAAAVKAKATRAARGITGKKQKAAITAPVVVTPTSASPIKSVTTAAGNTVTASGATTSMTAAPAATGAASAVVGAGGGVTAATAAVVPAAAASTSPPATAAPAGVAATHS
jgi:hypothetical protein